MTTITDMHCHLLPGLDDGSASMEETLDTLREAKRQHIDSIIVTPHFHPTRYMVYAEQIFQTLGEVRDAAARAGIDIALYPGQECYYYSGLVEQLDSGRALTLCATRYVLVEFEPNASFSTVRMGINDLSINGYIPIIAHFERYVSLRDKDKLSEIKKYAFLQMNFDTLLHDSILNRNPWRRLLQAGYVDYLGSDCHGMNFRPYQTEHVMKWIRNKVKPEISHAIFETGIQRLTGSYKKD